MERPWWNALFRSLIGFALITTGACSTVIEGTDQSVVVTTEPQGATCVLWRNGERVGAVGQTPGSTVISKSISDITVKCTEFGYQETSEILTSGGSGWSLGNIVFGPFGGSIGLIVDTASGAINKYPDNIHVDLVPANFATEQDRDRFFDARVARREAEFEKADQQLEEQCRARGAELCNARRKNLSEIREKDLAAMEEKRQAVVVEDSKPSQNQTNRSEHTEMGRAGASDQPENAAWPPSVRPSERTEIAALPPAKSRQEVEAYLSQSKSGFQRKPGSYNVRQRVLVDDYGLTEVTQIYSWEIKRLDGDLVLLEVNYEVVQPGYSTAGCRVLELKWVGADLEFVRPRGACT